MSEVLKMDEIDRQIISLVQKNPAYTHTELAKMVNRSQPTVGMRIRKLEEMGVLQFQAGINMKTADLCFARVELETSNPQAIFDIVKKCPFMLNCFRESDELNLSVYLVGFTFKEIERIVNFHFRNKPDVNRVIIKIVTDVLVDLILPLDFNFNHCDCKLSSQCFDVKEEE